MVNHTISILVLLMLHCSVQAFYIINGNVYSASSEKHRRVKREWSYPPVYIMEFVSLNGQPFARKEVVPIKSSNPAVASYILLNSPEVQNGIFTIESSGTSAKIFQEKPIDREELTEDKDGVAFYTLYARALNTAGQQVEPTDAEIKVIVTDLNDNKPVFDTSTLQGEVNEDAGVGDSFMTVKATDADGKNLNYGVVRYFYGEQVDPPSETPLFAVTQSTGDITVIGPLDRESTPTIKFTVRAEDGSPQLGSLSQTATVTVQVLDANDHVPVFENEPYNSRVGELTLVETTIQTVYADDLDAGVNRAVEFRINFGNTNDHFGIRSFPNPNGQSYGEIFVKNQVDYETGPKTFNLEIVAFNPEAENAEDFTSSATVQVDIEDENEPPIFRNEPYSGYLRENRQELVDSVATVQAVDLDFGGIQSVTYSLVNGFQWFSINQEGVISAIAPVDRENPLVDQATSIFILTVQAQDNDKEPKSSTADIAIKIGDVNDNAPQKDTGWAATICEEPSNKMKSNVTVIRVKDIDSSTNGPPFRISIVDGYSSPFYLELLAPTTGAIVQTLITKFNAAEVNKYEIPIELVDTASAGESQKTSTETLTISVCRCNHKADPNSEPECADGFVAPGGVNIFLIIIIIAVILILLIIILAVVAYRRRSEVDDAKRKLFYDEDDVRENLQAYHDEGGGEEDNDGYDISALQAPPLVDPKRHDVTPLTAAQPQPRSKVPPDTDIGDYINEAKQQADNDPTAPPFDSLLVFDFEGLGSGAGSLSSLNSGTTDGSQDYDYLNEWGPKFKKLADMYGGGESD